MKKLKVGIFGATGKVGTELIKVLYHRQFSIKSLRLFASSKSAGNTIDTPAGEIVVEESGNVNWKELDLAFFAIDSNWALENAEKAVKAGCFVVDNSSAFRYDEKIPLVIPEINAEEIKKNKLISNPNCTTAICAIPLYVISENYGLEKVIISTYQAASGAGALGMQELRNETLNYLEGKKISCESFYHPIPFNVIPHIDIFQINGYSREEMKVVWESRKIMNLPELKISSTCVRIPTFRAHAMSVTVETKQEIYVDDIRKKLDNQAGVKVKDNTANNSYPMPLSSTGDYNIEVGRIRQNLIFENKGIDLFICGDQLLKGAALNAVQIAEYALIEGII
ncbi:MAG: aspartate-semialdehyde dehydrogenase [Candidatus Muiribacteriota bacterium]